MHMKKAPLSLALLAILSAIPLCQMLAQWKQSSGPYGGFIWCLAITDHDTLLAGTSNSGIFRSTDNGSTWKALHNGLSYYQSGVGFIASRPGELFAGNAGILFRSRDGGDSWSKIEAAPVGISTLAIQPNGYLFAGTDGTSVNGYTGAVFVSSDDGDTWTGGGDSLPSANQATGFAFQPDGGVIAGTWRGLFRSTDEGLHWTSVPNLPYGGLFIGPMATNPQGYIFMSNGYGLFRSADNGGHWTNLGRVPPIGFLTIRPDGSIYVRDYHNLYVSTDTGMSWIPAGFGASPPPDNVFFNSTGDLFSYSGTLTRSTDNGAHWTTVGLPMTFVNDLLFTNAGALIAGCSFGLRYDGGVHLSTDRGVSWSQLNSGGAMLTHAVAIDSEGVLYAGGEGGLVFRSVDSGKSWTGSSSGPSYSTINSVAAHPNGDVWAGSNFELDRSTDHGVSWSKVRDGAVSKVLVDSSGSILIGGDGIYKSTDAGASWASIGDAVGSQGIRSLALGPGSRLFAGIGSPGGGGKVYFSTDEGSSWTSTPDDLSAYLAWSECVNARGGVFVGTVGAGVWYWNGHKQDHWRWLYNNFTETNCRAITIDNAGILYAGSDSGGVFIGSGSTTLFTASREEVRFDTARMGYFRDDSILVSNRGTEPLSISSVVSSSPSFSVLSTGGELKIGESMYFHIRFEPLVPDSQGGTISFLSNAITSPDDVDLSGIGKPRARLHLGSPIVNFSDTRVDSSRDTVVALANDGYDTLRIVSARSGDTSFAANELTSAIPPDSPGWIRIRFSPSVVGLRQTTMVVTSNSINSPDTIRLSGRGYIPGVPDRPANYFLSPNYPNPFNHKTRIIFGVPRDGHVTLTLYNLRGQVVETLVDEFLRASSYQVDWNQPGLASGIYYLQMTAGSFKQTHKLMLMK